MLPIPGMEKMISTIKAPVRSIGKILDSADNMGISVFLKAYLNNIVLAENPQDFSAVM